MNCSSSGFPILHYLLEFAQTHVHWVSDDSLLGGILVKNVPLGQVEWIQWPRSQKPFDLAKHSYPPHMFRFSHLNKGDNNCSLLFSHQVMFDSSWPHGLQYARHPCPPPPPRVSPSSCPLHQWYHPAISSSVVPFSSCLCQHQGLFQWVTSLHHVAKVWELQHQSFQWILSNDFL